jgi:Holliday junction resolvasome RuvABC ATP-dependent DNA helicase subunit
MNIIGQTKLLSKINAMEYLPKTLMLLGPTGCGKHTIARYVAEEFKLDFVEIEESVSAQDLEDYTHKTIDTLYLINLNKFTEKQQNQFLKFIEEPSKSVYVILIANSEAGILNTILNRSIKHHLEPYTKEEIEQITNTKVNDLAFKIFQTPGKLLNLTEQSFNDVMGLANTIVHSIDKASYPNALVVSTKINYKDLYSKIDFDLFFDAVEYLALEDYKNNKTVQSLTVFKTTNQFKQYATQQNLIKEILMINYLTTLWEAVH